MNHKWKYLTCTLNTKTQQCIKCGVHRDWMYGDYQCWRYWWPMKNEFMGLKETFNRPACTVVVNKDLK